MTLQETAQIRGGVGVIASIIYVGIQIRNNARAMRAAIDQQLSAISIQGWIALAQNGETTEIILRGLDDFFRSLALKKPGSNGRSARCAKVTGKPPQVVAVKTEPQKSKTTKA